MFTPSGRIRDNLNNMSMLTSSDRICIGNLNKGLNTFGLKLASHIDDINIETLLILITDGDRRGHRHGARGKKHRRRPRVGGLWTYDTRC